ncbi:hypothetical protein Bhyg_13620 [Pseudolycoriella hygida]|uniref:Uncharacterized protein n=1 Tax=Pseudolycoriella hygida TaxID=35572 RepID=A0A9Q0RWM9_9DIPT|nr:hypothetical protein Bhyg_13620 [Pseudolycoriella hygida]
MDNGVASNETFTLVGDSGKLVGSATGSNAERKDLPSSSLDDEYGLIFVEQPSSDSGLQFKSYLSQSIFKQFLFTFLLPTVVGLLL